MVISNELILLAGGFGTRLHTVLPDTAKALAPVSGVPFIKWQLQYFQLLGFKRIIISTHYLSQQIKAYLSDQLFDLEVIFAEEPEPLGTGGAIRFSLEHCHQQHVFVCNGDSFCLWDKQAMQEQHHNKASQLTVWLTKKAIDKNFAYVSVTRDNKIISFSEQAPDSGVLLINAGLYLCDRLIFNSYPLSTAVSFEQKIIPDIVARQKADAIVGSDPIFDIGTPETLQEADVIMNKKWSTLCQ